ncbi:amino acid adenylation domain-containing protein [Micromonospora sp. LOL_025]|uniref:amino acid adenylation domain-containing protein n=1 Tax=Micromonospora sp. LOL_025 TaxID=3345413 RepID=UPI003A8620D8
MEEKPLRPADTSVMSPAAITLSLILRRALGAHAVEENGSIAGRISRQDAEQVVADVRAAFHVDLDATAVAAAGAVADLVYLLQQKMASVFDDEPGDVGIADHDVIPRHLRGAPLPTSFGQRRLWLQEQLRPGSSEYVMPVTMRLAGPVDREMLARALTMVIERHEVLRSRIVPIAGEPMQVVDDPAPVELPLMVGDALQIVKAESARPFALGTERLIRPMLIRTPDGYVLALLMHHAICDNWSLRVLARELDAAYTALAAGRALDAPAPRLQYGDFAAWQRQWMSGPRLERNLQYWRGRLADFVPTYLPTDRPRPAHWDPRGGSISVVVPADVAQAVVHIGQKHSASPFTVFLAAFQILLSRFTGSHDVTVGSSVAARTQVETEDMIGFFVNTLALRSRLDDAESFAQLLPQVRDTVLGALAHQELPFEALVEDLSPTRDLAENPFFQVMLVMQNTGATDHTFPIGDLTGQYFRAGKVTAQFDLHWTLQERPDGSYALESDYAAALFDRESVAQITEHYLTLLRSVARDPDKPIRDLDLLNEAQHSALVADQGEHVEVPDRVHEMFRRAARSFPDSIAVVQDERQMTYAELDRLSDCLAHRIGQAGVAAESPVAILLPRSPEAVATILGVLKAGAAYVPLDPQYPRNRVDQILDDVDPVLVVTDAVTAASLNVAGRPAVDVRMLLDVTVDSSPPAPAPTPEPGPAPVGQDLAYVLYTSGSTGMPKGAAVTHAGIANRVAWAVHEHGMTSEDRMLHRSSLAFDAAGWEIFAPLVSGGQVVIAPPEVHRDVAGLLQRVVTHDVTILQVVPSLLEALLTVPDLARCQSLRRVFSAGEVLRPDLAERLRTVLPQVELINTYGPTECAIDVSAWRYSPADAHVVPIGRPLINTQLYVVDANMRLVPQGAPGELCVGGVQVGRGYARRPGLTAASFVPDPFSATPGQRLYRTGDRVRRTADGALVFLGRIDDQVKVRGFRIEPREIEAVLLTHPGVRSAAVGVHGDGGERGLVAYVVPADSADFDTAQLRSFTEQLLPEHMVPSWWTVLDELPLTPSGKLDRRALPAPDRTRGAAQGAYAAPRDEREEGLTGAWAQVLGIDRVGLDDDFFQLGGNSLLAIRMLARLQDLGIPTGPDLLRVLFAARTPRAILAALGESGAPQETANRIPRRHTDGQAPLSFAQERLWFLEQLRPGTAEYVLPMALRLTGVLDSHALRQALTAVCGRHEVLRATVDLVDGSAVQRFAPCEQVPLTVVEGGLAEVCQVEAARPFDLRTDALVRVTLVRESAESHVLLLVLHHLVFDGASVAVLLRDLDAAYRSAAAGQPASLAEPEVRYGDYAGWQREWVDSPRSSEDLDYWRQQLAGVSPLELPTDRPRPPEWEPIGGDISVRVPADLAAAVALIGSERGATPFMSFLAAFQVLLAHYSGGEDIAVGTPVSGRTRAEFEDVVGLFVNTVVLRSTVEGNPGFDVFLDRVRDVAIDAFLHQEVPFERVVEALAPERDLSRNPLFQVMFVLENEEAAGRSVPVGDLTAEMLPVDNGTAKFDQTWSLTAEATGGYRLDVQYSSALFDRDTVVRMTAHYLELLRSIVARPTTPVLWLGLVASDERAAMLAAAEAHPATQARGPGMPSTGHLVYQRVAAAAAATPHAVAVVDGDREVSYGELDRWVNRLAHHLRSLGVGPEVRVVVALPRRVEVVVTLLAVLRAGGVYVPLDPQHPVQRLSYLLDDTSPAVVVTDDSVRDRLPETSATVVEIGGLRLDAHPDTPPEVRVDPDNLAYVIYTSGSTGTPKGAAISHAAYAHHCEMIKGPYRIEPGSRILLLSALTFDVAMDQIGATLAFGATIVMGHAAEWGPDGLVDRVHQYGVTTIEITPAHYREVMHGVRHDDPRLRHLRVMNVGSDVVTYQDARLWTDRGMPDAFLCNYGPTETTVTCTLYPVTAEEAAQAHPASTVPIGFPVAGTRAYVVNTAMDLVPPGVPGELVIGGPRLGRGYAGRPGVTADRWVPDAFSSLPGSRLYRTGDLVRQRADGALLFLGRLDQQVKVRGFRIELGEVEAALAAHPAVRAAAVKAHGDGAGRGLAAYLVRSEVSADIEELRAFVAARLPDYMVPTWWIDLTELPLTSSGKVDRKALPPVTAGARPSLGQHYVGPRSEVEAVIADIWAQVLGLERVGVHDRFFDLGGHSLLAARLLARINGQFDLELPLRVVFDADTVARLAVAVEDAVSAEIDRLSIDELELAVERNGEHR